MKYRWALVAAISGMVFALAVACSSTAGLPDGGVLTDSGQDAAAADDAGDAGWDASPEADAGVADSGTVVDSGPADAAPDAAQDAGDAGVVVVDGGVDASTKVEYPPDKPGKYPVGYYKEDLKYDSDRKRVVPFHVWYPAMAPGAKTVNYLLTSIGLLPGGAYENVPAAKADGPFPLILFSHGFKGIAFQSFKLVEYLASHGFVVVAPNHQGNTLLDFGFTKEQEKQTVSNVTLLRPGDVGFAYKTAIEYNTTKGHILEGMINKDLVAMTGHSFGGFTSLIVSGAEADMDRAKAACAAGVAADVMCPYVGYYAAGTMLKMDPKIPGLKAMVALTPGGFNAIFADNLAKVMVPSLVMGGSEDDTCPVAIETQPIFDGLPAPKILSIITGASHMSYTNVCSIPLVGSLMGDMCKATMTEDRAFEIINPIVTAYIRRHVLDEAAMDQYLDQAWITKTFPEAGWIEIK
ncbi:MAG: hypothetical protein WC889_06620 [Myxococcota bacterium]|jgi:predicted dienelactone hydrolase